jgi:Rieske Fe-S protein
MPTRRDVLIQTAAVLAAVPLASCAREEPPALPPGAIRVALADLPEGVRVVRMRIDEPVEIVRTGSTVHVRSLICTHFGCTLAWSGETRRYNCPCHAGAFDESGRPVAGPPTEPMRVLPVRIEGGDVIVMQREMTG